MPRQADTIIFDGHAFSWERFCELHRLQLQAREAAHVTAKHKVVRQLASFSFGIRASVRLRIEGSAVSIQCLSHI
jgi:hypothetical protein